MQRAVGCYDFTLATQNLITPLTYWNVMGTSSLSDLVFGKS